MRLFVQSTVEGKEHIRFEVKSYNAETHQGTVTGAQGVEFAVDLSKDNLIAKGYKIVKGE